VQTRRLHESSEGSYSSLASSSGELPRVIASYCSHQWETNAFPEFWGKMGFLGHNFGSRHARRRSGKGSIDVGDHLVSKKSLNQNIGPLDWHPRPVKVGQKTQNTLTLRVSPRCPHPNQKKKFFNRTKKTYRIRRGFKQLSSYSGWWVITKKPRANKLARAVVKGLTPWRLGGFGDFHKKNSSFWLPYQRPSSSADCARQLFNGSNGSTSL